MCDLVLLNLLYEGDSLVYKGYSRGKKVAVKYNLFFEGTYDREYQISLKAHELVPTPKPLIHVEYSEDLEIGNYLSKSVIVFEWQKGETIQSYLNSGFIPNKKDVMNQMLDIVETLHKASIFHQDLCPLNWMLHEGKVIVIDFGGASMGHIYNKDRKLDINMLAMTMICIFYNLDDWDEAANILREGNSLFIENMSLEQMRKVVMSI